MFKQSRNLTILLTFALSLLLEGSAQAQTYYVRPGDTLYTIANRFGTTPAQLQAANGLSSAWIYPGQALNVPGGSASVSSVSGYTVVSGDSLYLIAKKFGVSVDALRQANHLSSDQIIPGQILTIPAGGGTDSGSERVYTVQPNDSLYTIAKRYGTTVDALRAKNGLTSDMLLVGQVLKLPPTAGTSTAANGTVLSASEIDLLARLVTAEAEGEPFAGQVAVAATVLNRTRDPNYPKTVHDVIYQVVDGIYYQYSPVLDGRINAPATADAYKAVSLAMQGWDPSLGAIGFYNPSKTTNKWVTSQPVTIVIGEHVFYK